MPVLPKDHPPVISITPLWPSAGAPLLGVKWKVNRVRGGVKDYYNEWLSKTMGVMAPMWDRGAVPILLGPILLGPILVPMAMVLLLLNSRDIVHSSTKGGTKGNTLVVLLTAGWSRDRLPRAGPATTPVWTTPQTPRPCSPQSCQFAGV